MCWRSYRSDDDDVRPVVDSITVSWTVPVHVCERHCGQGPPDGQCSPILHVVVVTLRTYPVASLLQPRLPDDRPASAAAAAARAGARSLGVHWGRRRGAAGAASSVGRVGDVGGRQHHGGAEPGRRADHSRH